MHILFNGEKLIFKISLLKITIIEYIYLNIFQPRQEAVVLELNVLKDDIQYILARIDGWVKPEKVCNIWWKILKDLINKIFN